MPRKTLYPRSVIKRTIKAHSGLRLSKNADILIFLDYTLFLQESVTPSSLLTLSLPPKEKKNLELRSRKTIA